jgi:site-specific recombinase XerD
MKLINEYLEYIEIERGRSKKTVDNYDRYLRRFLVFSGVKDPANITDERVRTYRLWLNRQGFDRHTQNYHLIALRGFLKYLVKRNVASLAAETIELAKTSARDIDIIDTDDLERLLAAPVGSALSAVRDRALLEMLFSTGLRVSEVCSLNRDSVNPQKSEFSVRGKGGKIRVVFISDKARSMLKEYVHTRGDISPALFVSVPRGSSAARIAKEPSRLTARTVQRLLKHYAIKAGISKHITPHTLRHMFATDLLMNGADIRSVQIMLGHANVATTQVYTHVTDRQLRDVHDAFHGIRRKEK